MSSKARTSNKHPHAVWDLEAVADAASRAIERETDRLRAEQSTTGVDFRTELEMHPLLRDGLAAVGGVHAEIRFPSGIKSPKRSEGERCDIVLTASPDLDISVDSPAPFFAHRLAEPEDALWIEVKVVAQHVLYDGYSRPNPNYTAELLQGVTADVTKLSREPRIVHAAVLLVLFSADERTAEHDLAAWHTRAIEKGKPVSVPITRTYTIPDLIGHTRCTLALARVHNL